MRGHEEVEQRYQGLVDGGEECLFLNPFESVVADILTSGWIELRSLLNNAQRWTFQALSDIKASVPLPVLEFHSDNGSEFINNATEAWCKSQGLKFTRSRDRKKNDNCFVEQKNGAVVRDIGGGQGMQIVARGGLPAVVDGVNLPEPGLFSFLARIEGAYGDAAFQGTLGFGEAFPLSLGASLSFLR